ncbi:hypothetical protein NECID01_2001 [Nematocida sp. AWRm77]|nr:hypothetical protein NECID01_2001 [Nematocida sp. AWRm77]
MSRIERITKRLKEAYPESEVAIENKTQEQIDYRAAVNTMGSSESDLSIKVVAKEFEGVSPLEATRAINKLIKDEFAKGLHSVSIECHAFPTKKDEAY